MCVCRCAVLKKPVLYHNFKREASLIKSPKSKIFKTVLGPCSIQQFPDRATQYMQNNQTSGGLARTTKANSSPAWANARAKKTNHDLRMKKGFRNWMGTTKTQDTQTSQDNTVWTDTSWDHADNWTDADWWSGDWSTDLWADAWEQAAGQWAPPQPAQERSNSTHGGNISFLGDFGQTTGAI